MGDRGGIRRRATDDPAFGPGRVLVVDDEPSLIDAVSTALRYEGYDVAEASTGRAGLSAALGGSADRFFRIDDARSRSTCGAGLGLSIVESIVHAHHGSVEIGPNVPTGLKVVVRLPAAPVELPDAARDLFDEPHA